MDPMAGVNTIPLEALLSFDSPIITLAGDFTEACNAEAETNTRFIRSRVESERESLRSQWEQICKQKAREAKERMKRGEKEPKRRKRRRDDVGESGEVFIEAPLCFAASSKDDAQDVNTEMKKKDILLPLESVRWDARFLPLRSSSVDVVVSDLPFGVRVGNSRIVRHVLPAIKQACKLKSSRTY